LFCVPVRASASQPHQTIRMHPSLSTVPFSLRPLADGNAGGDMLAAAVPNLSVGTTDVPEPVLRHRHASLRACGVCGGGGRQHCRREVRACGGGGIGGRRRRPHLEGLRIIVTKSQSASTNTHRCQERLLRSCSQAHFSRLSDTTAVSSVEQQVNNRARRGSNACSRAGSSCNEAKCTHHCRRNDPNHRVKAKVGSG
jgi:hypothetical protein